MIMGDTNTRYMIGAMCEYGDVIDSRRRWNDMADDKQFMLVIKNILSLLQLEYILEQPVAECSP